MWVIIIILLISSIAYGTTYPILEEDFLFELEKRASTNEFKEQLESERQANIEAIRQMKGVSLKKANDNRSYEVTYSYTLQQDIPRVDRAGNIIGILYPKGYNFNPLSYLLDAPTPLLIFNPCDEKERAFVDNSTFKNDYMLVASGCSLKDIKAYNSQVYLLKDEMVKMFKLTSTISIVKVNIKKGVFDVETINVD